jgi:hypothetical protein
MQALAISPRRAARSVTTLATGPLAHNGEYYDQRTPTPSSPASYDPQAATRLWAITERICGHFDPATEDARAAER